MATRVNVAIYEEARDFAGADWEKLSKGSRERLLMANGRSPAYKDLTWRQLPESVKMALIKPMVVEKRELQTRHNKRMAKR